MSHSVYLDHNATTPLDPRVLERMLPFFHDEFGNPSSSTHTWGLRARNAVESARTEVATLIGARPREIVFTAGATESNNFALKGVAWRSAPGSHLVVTRLEHPSVLAAAESLERMGYVVTVLDPGPDGRVSASAVQQALRANTRLVSVCAANGEIGTVQPVAEIGRRCAEAGVLFHSDGTQAVGKIPVDVEAWGVAALSMSGHKMYGPKGVGALYLREGVEVEPLLSGGGQEHGLRSGTLNVPGIVGLGEVCRLRREEMDAEAERLRAMRERLWAGIRDLVSDARLNGHPTERIPGSLSVAFPRMPSERLMSALKGFALSAGSACKSGADQAPPVLTALGLDGELARCTVRFGLGKSTRDEDVDALLIALGRAVRRLRPGGASTPLTARYTS